MRGKSAVIMCILIASFLLVSACSARDKIAQPSVSTPLYEWGKVSGKTIVVWGDPGDLSRPYITRAFANYTAATGNIIKCEQISKAEADSKAFNAFSQPGATRPDILLSYGGANIDNLNPDENFYDFSTAPWVDDLTDTSINQAIYNAKVIGLPFGEASVSGTLYNKEIFKKYNLKIPTTQEEFLDVCETLLKNGITPIYLPYAEITMLLYQFPMDSIVQDATVLEKLNNGTLSYSQIPEMLKIINWYKTMSDRGYFGDNYIQNNWDGMDAAMKSREYAMMLCWDTWLHTSFTGDQSTMGIMPAFIGTPNSGCFEGANILLTLVNKNSSQLHAVLDLISFMADPVNYNVAFADLYAVPLFKSQTGSITTPQYIEAERLIDKFFYNSTAWSRIRGFSQIDAMYIQQYMQNKCSAIECLDAMDAARIKRGKIIVP